MPKDDSNPLRRVFAWLRGLGQDEGALLLAALALVLGLWGFAELTDEVTEQETRSTDQAVLEMLRTGEKMEDTVGPWWLQEAAIEITALGSKTVAGFVTLVVAGFLAMTRHYRSMIAVLAAAIGGSILGYLAKGWIDRARPDVVPALTSVHTPSFPSGHAMTAAVVYLTLAAMLCQAFPGKGLKLFFLGIGLLVTLLVGVSRVYLGVHYPTDVLAGWAAGIAWAALVWAFAELSRRRRNSSRSNMP